MVQQITLPQQSYNAYHHNNSLMFQFILTEFIHASRELMHFDNLSSDAEITQIQHLQLPIRILAGCHKDHSRYFALNQENGIFPRLKAYSAILIHNGEAHDKSLLALNHQITKAWLLCIESLDAFSLLQAHPLEKDYLTALHRLLKKLMTSTLKLRKLIAEIILSFNADENVLFFVLRHKEQLDKIYGAGFVKKIFRKMYPDGLAKADQFLRHRYTNRGFENLAVVITSKIAELQAARP